MSNNKGRRRRFHSQAFKRMVVASSYEPGQSVSCIARRHDLNANLVFKWRRDPQLNDFLAEQHFLPVELVADTVAPLGGGMSAEAMGDKVIGSVPVSGGCLEIDLPCGTRLRCASDLPSELLTEALSVLRRSA